MISASHGPHEFVNDGGHRVHCFGVLAHEPPVAAPDHASIIRRAIPGAVPFTKPEYDRKREADNAALAALDALLVELQQDKERIKRADGELKSIIIRCEEGDRKADWLPTIARLARSARAVLAGEGDATATVKPGDVCPACGNRRGVANPTTYACTECWNALQVAAGAGDATPPERDT